ncbi:MULTISPECIES: 4'-phosphopantetheinyl transferase superfamily protein [Cyanophyceae]|uniref:4'-phosphopantetheinyl transferase family protein n=1 Tax=Cyanophyceae TaxID=3028117 RepID=UPI00168548FE|nr:MULTISPECIES: 4'-phosphopantetheinyl transferase superfamily protein [Cyanophyceae]MBD1915175.1 4'-phosphopantetheinyl transferase superfamily protein [Phormidium sp. FACHB-77]MBD2028437.1 4'-phosphopantetheinyl transferase superfamily protein [Phormidium sp. FACHB-322]MBD2051857.1 4'-phosphopantetheinyl transferase superfamily protein [Leptolyngbya sp. FACHB-60]
MALIEQCQAPNLRATYETWLDDRERSRYERFRFNQHRQEYLVAHALLRSCLSRYGDRQPWEWAFSTNDYGRPELSEGNGSLPLRFNLSHTTSLVACAVTRFADVGVDVEYTARKGDLAAIAKTSFAPEELAELNRLTGMAWRDRFFDLWTLKEAYIKARGLGLSLPLQQCVFQFEPKTATPIQCCADSAEDWVFELLSPTPQHRLAVAVHCSTPLQIQVGQAIPGEVFQLVQLPITTSRGVA